MSSIDATAPLDSPPAAVIGVFDSGVGGLSVLRDIHAQLPQWDLVYLADSAHVPYGTKPPAFIRARSLAITRHLIEHEHAAAIVVACNTATTHGVDGVRAAFPATPIIGIEPAVKPAALATRSGIVGVLATGATLEGGRFATLVERHADAVQVLTQPCPGLVDQVENGELSAPETIELLRRYTAPMLARGADTIALGCTHYPFLREALQQVVGPAITLIDTGAAVARQTARMLAAHGKTTDRPATSRGTVRFLTTGDPALVGPVIERLWGEAVAAVEHVEV